MNTMYPLGRQAYSSASVNFPGDTIRVYLLTSAYAYSSLHQFVSDLTGIVSFAVLTGATDALGVCAGTNVLFAGLTGSAVASVVVAKWTGVAGTSPLLKYYSDAGGMPFTPTGQNVTLVWPGNGIMSV